MAKSLKDILAGTKSSKVEKLNHKDMYQWGSPDGLKFVDDKHPVEKHADRAGNGDDVYQGKTKPVKYPRQNEKVYEETEELDEISKQKAERYLEKSSKDYKSYDRTAAHAKHAGKHASPEHKASWKDEEDWANKQASKRLKGSDTAVRKIHGGAKVAATEEVEDLEEKYMGFQKLKTSLAAKGAKSPGALAAWIGRKKYGKEKFQKAAATDHKLKEDSHCNHTNEGTYCEAHGMKACPSDNDMGKREKAKGKKLLLDKKKIDEAIINEVAPPNKKIENWIKSNKERFIKEYGKEKGTQVLYAKAWKMHGQSESGTSSPATNSDYAGPGAAGWTTGRLDVGTL